MAQPQNEHVNHPITVPSKSPAGIVRNPDGSYTRFIQFPCTPATLDDNSPNPVLSKDLTINAQNETWLRIYLPRKALDQPPSCRKLPIIVYFHGGGFVFVSAASTVTHLFCEQLAAAVGVVVVSVEYRLAPEHRLPAAYNDAVEALQSLQNTQEEWLKEHADFSNCFLMGSSAGGNIAYHAGLRVAAEVIGFGLLKIKGLILHHPFFGGLERTGSELRLGDGSSLTLKGCDLMWALSLPVGADRDHEYCNPVVRGESGQLDRVRVRVLDWRVLVTGCFGDLLIDRQMEFKKMLEENGLKTVAHFVEGYHGMEVSEPLKAKELFVIINEFIGCHKLKICG